MSWDNNTNIKLKPKILIVDDVPANLLALNAVLESSVTANVYQAGSGEEALTLVLEHDFSLVLLDVQMPEMDGYEVASILQSSKNTKHLPIIFLTAVYKGERHQQKGYKSGAVDYLEKPVDDQMLLAKVRVFLELHNKQQLLEQQKKKTEITLSAIPDPVISVQGDNITYMNVPAEELARMFGLPMKCTSLKQLFSFSQSNLNKIQKLVKIINNGNKNIEAIELHFDSPVSQITQIYEFRVVPLVGEKNSVTEVVLVFHDISSIKTLSNKLAHQAFHDSLTRLPNRNALEDALKTAVARYKRSERDIALMLIDLDDFKKVNDTSGHQIGDKVLREAAMRIQDCLRESDMLCRLGGDEFCILFEDVESLESLETPAQRIIESVAQKFIIEKHEFSIGSSIGITTTLIETERDSIGMLSDVDMAMYSAKRQGKNCYQFFDEKMRKNLQDIVRLDNELYGAASNAEFCLYYQPQICVRSGKVNGLEALIRWNHPNQGLVGPSSFLSVLEDSGLIVSVGRWVIEDACRQISEWLSASFTVPCVSVNVSALQFEEKGFSDFVEKTIANFNIPPSLLGIEITETLFLESTQYVEKNLYQLHNLGCKIAMDDFGTGYSSLGYLLNFPIDTIKIDQSFIKKLDQTPQCYDLVKAVITFAHGFKGMKVISEGVEEASTLEILRKMGCDMYQGYHYSRPLTADYIQMMYLE